MESPDSLIFENRWPANRENCNKTGKLRFPTCYSVPAFDHSAHSIRSTCEIAYIMPNHFRVSALKNITNVFGLSSRVFSHIRVNWSSELDAGRHTVYDIRKKKKKTDFLYILNVNKLPISGVVNSGNTLIRRRFQLHIEIESPSLIILCTVTVLKSA